MWRSRTRVPLSDVHRTVVDLLDEPAIGGGGQHVADCLATYLDRDNRDDKTLLRYAKKPWQRRRVQALRLPGRATRRNLVGGRLPSPTHERLRQTRPVAALSGPSAPLALADPGTLVGDDSP